MIGSFNDIFVPVVSNEKPVDVETIQEDSPSMQDDFLEWLLKALTAGVGIPHAFIADTDTIQFAKTLTMENAKFLRSVVIKQRTYGDQFSQMLRILYRNEYDAEQRDIGSIEKDEEKDINKHEEDDFKNGIKGKMFLKSDDDKKKKKKKSDEEKNKKKDEEDKNNNGIKDEDEDDIEISLIDRDLIYIRFPSPASLNTTNMSEQIGNTTGILDFLTEITVGSSDENLARGFKERLARELIKTVPWDKIDRIIEDMKVESVRKALKKKTGADEGEEGEM
jgi:hypothetical protein